MKNKLIIWVIVIVISVLIVISGSSVVEWHSLSKTQDQKQEFLGSTKSFISGIKIASFLDLSTINRTLKEISQLGVKDVLFEFIWPIIETSNNTYNWFSI